MIMKHLTVDWAEVQVPERRTNNQKEVNKQGCPILLPNSKFRKKTSVNPTKMTHYLPLAVLSLFRLIKCDLSCL